MPLTDPQRGWWGQQCPRRQPGLSHAHDRDCENPAHERRCCECGSGPDARPPELPASHDHVWYLGRCTVQFCQAEQEAGDDDEHGLVEPAERASDATDAEPVHLTERFKRKLIFYCLRVRAGDEA